MDYRAINKIRFREMYPLPLIEDKFDPHAGFKYLIFRLIFRVLSNTYISRIDSVYTAFVTPEGMYEFLRMPFGLANGPAVFQRMIHIVCSNLRYNKILIYLYDILIVTG